MKCLSSASARPNFVKLASVDHALRAKGIEHVIVHTGQHYDPLLSDVFFTQLDITEPKYNLGIKGKSDREAVIADTADAFEGVLMKEKPDVVFVYGDVNGAVGAARAAKKLGFILAHVEAGLRSFDTDMPEELNRIEIDSIADYLFTTEISANEILKKEGRKGEVHFVGNTMIDTLLSLLPLIQQEKAPEGVETFAVSTIHRPSNVDSQASLQSVFDFLSDIPMTVLLPLHPRTKAALAKFALSTPQNVRLIDPLGYIQFLGLCSHAAFILTDSGGIQEEAVILGKKCFTLRRNTERPSTIASGSNTLIDPSLPGDRQQVIDFAVHPSVSITVPPLWDGKAGDRILDVLSAL
ncbi:MAG: UDP-N-acetylglucosamine 2-epimerase (non-hydrolyzing) [Candidatus Peribacteraceae bacterium]